MKGGRGRGQKATDQLAQYAEYDPRNGRVKTKREKKHSSRANKTCPLAVWGLPSSLFAVLVIGSQQTGTAYFYPDYLCQHDLSLNGGKKDPRDRSCF